MRHVIGLAMILIVASVQATGLVNVVIDHDLIEEKVLQYTLYYEEGDYSFVYYNISSDNIISHAEGYIPLDDVRRRRTVLEPIIMTGDQSYYLSVLFRLKNGSDRIIHHEYILRAQEHVAAKGSTENNYKIMLFLGIIILIMCAVFYNYVLRKYNLKKNRTEEISKNMQELQKNNKYPPKEIPLSINHSYNKPSTKSIYSEEKKVRSYNLRRKAKNKEKEEFKKKFDEAFKE